MSIKIMTRVWEESPAKGSELLLLLAMADWANEDGWCWPSFDTLAKKTRLSRRQVINLVNSCEEKGYLIVEHGGGRSRSSRYQVVIGEKISPMSFLNGETGYAETVKPSTETVKPTSPDTLVDTSTDTLTSNDVAKDAQQKEEAKRMHAEALGIVFEFYNVTGGKQPPNLGANIKAAKHFITLGGNVSMVRDYIEFFRGQQWFTGAITMNTLASDKLFDRYWNERNQPRQKRKTLPTL